MINCGVLLVSGHVPADVQTRCTTPNSHTTKNVLVVLDFASDVGRSAEGLLFLEVK